ncbi:hypothetical protein BX616_008670, partial [Lobosporangium transversale]
IGWFITFIAACTIGASVHLIWVDIFYNLFLLLGTALAVSTQALQNYRLVILTFIAGSLSLLFLCIDASITFSSAWGKENAKYNAAGAGLIFQSFVL